jgi:hypothetical protein
MKLKLIIDSAEITDLAESTGALHDEATLLEDQAGEAELDETVGRLERLVRQAEDIAQQAGRVVAAYRRVQEAVAQ